MKEKSVTYAGKVWNQDQFLELIIAIIKKGYPPSFSVKGNFYLCEIPGYTAKAKTRWLALVAVIEKMEQK